MTKAASVNWAEMGTTWVSRNLMSRRTNIPVFNETALVVRVKPVGATPGVLCRQCMRMADFVWCNNSRL